VKTTPKPRATKKRSGELGPPLPPPLVGEGEDVGLAVPDGRPDVVLDIVAGLEGCDLAHGGGRGHQRLDRCRRRLVLERAI
jgi:hypothetical protein